MKFYKFKIIKNLFESLWRGIGSSVVMYAAKEWDTMDNKADRSHSLENICPSPSLKVYLVRFCNAGVHVHPSKPNQT